MYKLFLSLFGREFAGVSYEQQGRFWGWTPNYSSEGPGWEYRVEGLHQTSLILKFPSVLGVCPREALEPDGSPVSYPNKTINSIWIIRSHSHLEKLISLIVIAVR
jgi:hypothetical protein